MNFLEDEQKLIISLLSKFGSIEEIRSLCMSSLSSSWIKDKKLSLLDLPKSPIFTPVRTSSFAPS